MKSKLQLLTSATAASLLFVLGAAAQPVPTGPVVNPATGLPFMAPSAAVPLLDPSTGLPLPQPGPQWIDPNWNDPKIVLTNVFYDGLPLSDVARQLREQFKNEFDILPMPHTPLNDSEKDWGEEVIRLQLRDVRASEVFNAMNLVFENDRTPLRWELKQPPTGRRWVLLRVLPDAAAQLGFEPQKPQTQRMVFYVGNLVGDEKSGGLTMEQIIKTITDIWPADFGKLDGAIQFHKEAQLLVVNGTPDQIQFIHQTLNALQAKADAARPKPPESKNIEELGNLIKTLKGIGDNPK